MKHFRKLIAVILTVVLTASIALPVVASAEAGVDGDHTSFEDFWSQMTDEEGNVSWEKLPKALFEIFFFVRFFEVISSFIRNIFGIEADTAA